MQKLYFIRLNCPQLHLALLPYRESRLTVQACQSPLLTGLCRSLLAVLPAFGQVPIAHLWSKTPALTPLAQLQLQRW